MPQQLQTVFNLSLLILYLCISAGCSRPTVHPAEAGTAFPIHIDQTLASLELALTKDQQVRGLMFREQMAANHGMLFVFQTPGPRGFWMQNTSLPLDIAYITADGVIREIHSLHPYNLNSVASRRSDILLALEMNRGWFRHNGIRPGSRIDLDDLSAALQQLGVPPSRYPFTHPNQLNSTAN